MCNELIHLELASHIIIYQVGQLAAAFNPAEGAAFPDTTSNKLECYAKRLLATFPVCLMVPFLALA